MMHRLLLFVCLASTLGLQAAAAKPRQARPDTWSSRPDWRADDIWDRRETSRHERSRRFISESGAAYGAGVPSDVTEQTACDETQDACMPVRQNRRNRRN